MYSGNSVRSQFAASLMAHKSVTQVASAGTDPTTAIHPLARAELRAHGLAPLAPAKTATHKADKPAVLFLCVHNAGKSQMALGLFTALAGDRAVAWSGGSEPGDHLNKYAVEAMAEIGIDTTGEYPKPWTDERLHAADVVITMGCGDTCPYYPGTRYEDWNFNAPPGNSIENVRPVRDAIEAQVRELLAELGVEVVTDVLKR
jgi:arsenate reductase